MYTAGAVVAHAMEAVIGPSTIPPSHTPPAPPATTTATWGVRVWSEGGARVEPSCPLDAGKVQAPAVVPLGDGSYRMFYTAIGPAKPYPLCQGYIVSALSIDGGGST
jgi:hypothetical protein